MMPSPPGPSCAFAADLPDGRHRRLLRVGGADRPVLAKRRRDVPADFFPAEAWGLATLRPWVRVPAVYGAGAGWIVLEDLGRGRLDAHGWRAAGKALAQVHAQAAPAFGGPRDGYCGDSPQANPPTTDGHAFFVEARLDPQLARAAHAGLLEPADLAMARRLCARLPALLPAAPAVLVHGDLWLGNLHACADGTPALIDAAAVHHGWAEADLAMLPLFGEPPDDFFAAYAADGALAPDWRERAPLLNLYHLLNHLNLFGAGYRSAIRAVLRRFGA